MGQEEYPVGLGPHVDPTLGPGSIGDTLGGYATAGITGGATAGIRGGQLAAWTAAPAMAWMGGRQAAQYLGGGAAVAIVYSCYR